MYELLTVPVAWSGQNRCQRSMMIISLHPHPESRTELQAKWTVQLIPVQCVEKIKNQTRYTSHSCMPLFSNFSFVSYFLVRGLGEAEILFLKQTVFLLVYARYSLSAHHQYFVIGQNKACFCIHESYLLKVQLDMIIWIYEMAVATFCICRNRQ